MNVLIKLKSIDKITIQLYLFYIKQTLKKLKLKFDFNIHLPSKKKKVTLLKSPHIYKTSMEQFQFTSYKCLFYIKNIKKEILYFLIKNKPKNIKLNIKAKN
jgi:small subunit ribosomal protein S10